MPSPDRSKVRLDLNDVAGGDGFLFVRDGVGVAGRGVAARVPYDDAARVLASIEHDDGSDGAGGPVAIGVLPFLPDSPAELVIPSAVVRKRADGTAWVTLIDDAERPIARTLGSSCRGVVRHPPRRRRRPLPARGRVGARRGAVRETSSRP